jgi:ADP-heptose:LPS heptosyltransferase/predicted SAM-dependent methyltransferase
MVWRAEDPEGNEAAKVRFDIVPFFGNSNLDLGCGAHKVWPNFVGIDNGVDRELFGRQMKPDMVVGTCERLTMFADGAIDCVFSAHLLEHIEDFEGALREWWRLVRPGGHLVLYLPHRDLYPNIGQPGSNSDHKHDFVEQDIIDAMTRLVPPRGWDLVVNEKRAELREYSFLQVYKKTNDAQCTQSWNRPAADKRVGIVRPGAYGDALWGGCVAAAFKKRGYDVTLYTGPVGREALRADPNIDRLITMPNGMLDDDEMILYFLWESRKYTEWVNLIGVVEGRLLPHPNELHYYWPARVRHAQANRNYYEAMFEMAGLPLEVNQRFHPTPEENAWAEKNRRELFNGPLVVIAPTGSGQPKTWPHVQRFMELMAEQQIYTVVLGEIRQEINAPETYGVVMGKDLPIRLAMTLAQHADVVIGTESAIVNAVASCDVPKIVMLSHSSAENLTKYWTNTVALEPTSIPCHPCHRLHNKFEFCTKDSVTGWAACQAAAHPEMVAEAVMQALQHAARKAA